jgi:hypothetical protein
VLSDQFRGTSLKNDQSMFRFLGCHQSPGLDLVQHTYNGYGGRLLRGQSAVCAALLLVAISSTGIIAKRSGHWTLRLERQDRVSQLSKSSWPFLTFSSKKRKILKGVLIFMMVRENLEALLLCVYQPFYDLEIFFDGVVVLSAIASSIKCWGICVRITIREMRSRLDYGLLA